MSRVSTCMSMGTKCCRKIIGSVFFAYYTPHVVHINSKSVGILGRAMQASIWMYIIVYVIWYKKGYQQTGDVESGVVTKVKGIIVTNYSYDELQVDDKYKHLYNRVWDVGDYVIPPLEKGGFFVATNMVITPNQTMGVCPEDPDVEGVLCDPGNNTCVSGRVLNLGNGVETGNCVQSDQNASLHVCEIQAWCPVEHDVLPLGEERALLEDSKHFTVLIKNSIEFPTFGKEFRRRNVLLNTQDRSYLRKCRFHPSKDPFCPIFRLGDIVANAGGNYTAMAVKGGIVSIVIKWNCDLDWDFMTYCVPKYDFERLDDPHASLSPGVNFRHSVNHEEDRRTLVKAYGIHFVIDVRGTGGKFNIIPLLLNIGTGFALVGVAPFICNLIIVYCMKDRAYYRQQIYLQVTGADAFHAAGAVRVMEVISDEEQPSTSGRRHKDYGTLLNDTEDTIEELNECSNQPSTSTSQVGTSPSCV